MTNLGLIAASALLGLAVVAAGLLPNRFTVVQDPINKTALRVDQLTGDIDRVENYRLVRLSPESAIDDATLAASNHVLSGTKINMKVEAAWANGLLHYQVALGPITEVKKHNTGYGNSVSVLFTDADGYTIAEQPVNLNSMTTEVDANGRPTRLTYNGDIALDYSRFAEITGWTPRWRLE